MTAAKPRRRKANRSPIHRFLVAAGYAPIGTPQKVDSCRWRVLVEATWGTQLIRIRWSIGSGYVIEG